MATRTLSFRSTDDFERRLEKAARYWETARSTGAEEEIERAARYFETCLLRALQPTRTERGRTSRILRATTEAFVLAVERAQRDAELEAAYREWAAVDREGEEYRRGALEAAAEIWREE
jgi:hypothetical protein